ncbi:hypothetical protein A3K80_02895 [Candidatus Bathyarchaeota archaeon RBG_13_38_9]|nr:MAG: hypothetical protein A3K80_02895 [Candidatus Bathyarchaeota archaeon RBG_13_38_9]
MLILDVLVVSGIFLYTIKPGTYDINGIKSYNDYNENYVKPNSTRIQNVSPEISNKTFTTIHSTQEQESPIIN